MIGHNHMARIQTAVIHISINQINGKSRFYKKLYILAPCEAWRDLLVRGEIYNGVDD